LTNLASFIDGNHKSSLFKYCRIYLLPDRGFVIHGCHWQQEIGDISDVHTQLNVSTGQLAHMQGIIDIFTAGRVYTANGQMPQVLPATS